MRQKRLCCYFCGSMYHRPTECKRYKTERSRKMNAEKKKLCYLCFVKSPILHLPENKECPTNSTCSGWYSTEHHSVFCPARVEEQQLKFCLKVLRDKKELKKSNIFLPKIDETLFSRFAETFEIDEKYLLGTSSALAQKNIPLRKIKVIEGLGGRHESLDASDSSTFVITLNFYLPNFDEDNVKKFFKQEIICKSRFVKLYGIKGSPEEILELFSSITREISIGKLNCNITFKDIIKKVPNLESFKMLDNSLKVNGETWVADLMKYKNGKNFQKLDIHLDTIEFDIQIFKEFLTTKSVHNVFVTINYKAGLSKEGINNFVEKIGKYFVEEQYPSLSHKPHIRIVADNSSRYFTFDIEEQISPSKPKMSRKRTHKQ